MGYRSIRDKGNLSFSGLADAELQAFSQLGELYCLEWLGGELVLQPLAVVGSDPFSPLSGD